MKTSGAYLSRKTSIIVPALLLGASVLMPFAASGYEDRWSTYDAFWDNPGAWLLGHQPFAGDSALISPWSAYSIAVTYQSGTDPILLAVELDAANGSQYTTALSIGQDSLTTQNLTVGNTSSAGVARVDQSGGAVAVTTSLGLGVFVSSTGEYNLSGTGNLALMLGTSSENIGYFGTGQFTQNDKSIHTVGGTMVLGGGSLGFGSYEMLDGTLTAGGIVVGGSGNLSGGSIFSQSGGGVSTGTLVVASETGSIGHYVLDGGALQSAGATTIGRYGTGTFVQGFAGDGGTNSVGGDLTLGLDGNGQYDLYSGTLNVNGSTTIGASGTGAFTQAGGTQNVNGDLILGVNGDGTYHLTVAAIKDLPLSTLSVVGNLAIHSGEFIQDGGAADVGDTLVLDAWGGDPHVGSYQLNDGSLETMTTEVGYFGKGTFSQAGGTHTVAGALWVGEWSGSDGSGYQLSGGTLGANYAVVANGGAASFDQSGGTFTVETDFTIGVGAVGSYTLGGTGALNVKVNEFVGRFSTGDFKQTGGANTTAALYVGDGAGAKGSYELSGGNLSTWWTYLGYPGDGVFEQTGGTHTTNSLLISYDHNHGRAEYDLKGGTLNVAGQIVNYDTFNFTGGSLQAAEFVNNQGARFTVSGPAVNDVAADFNAATGSQVNVSGRAVFKGKFVLDGALYTDPSTTTFEQDLTIGTTGFLNAAPGDEFVMDAGFINNSTDTADWNTAQAVLTFSGTGPHLFNPGNDSLFKWGTVNIAPGATIDFTAGTLYVDTLYGVTLGDNGEPTNVLGLSSDVGIFYSKIFDVNGTPLFGGEAGSLGGPLTMVPIPATAPLLGSGIAIFAAQRRRRAT